MGGEPLEKDGSLVPGGVSPSEPRLVEQIGGLLSRFVR